MANFIKLMVTFKKLKFFSKKNRLQIFENPFQIKAYQMSKTRVEIRLNSKIHKKDYATVFRVEVQCL